MAKNNKIQKFQELVEKAKEIERKSKLKLIDFIENPPQLNLILLDDGRYYRTINS